MPPAKKLGRGRARGKLHRAASGKEGSGRGGRGRGRGSRTPKSPATPRMRGRSATKRSVVAREVATGPPPIDDSATDESYAASWYDAGKQVSKWAAAVKVVNENSLLEVVLRGPGGNEAGKAVLEVEED